MDGTPMILEAGVQEIVISRSGETFAAVCDDCKVRCRGRLRHATWQDLPAGGRQRQESRSSSESMNFSNSEDEAPHAALMQREKAKGHEIAPRSEVVG